MIARDARNQGFPVRAADNWSQFKSPEERVMSGNKITYNNKN